MKHGVYFFAIILLSLKIWCHCDEEKSRYGKIKELVSKNMHLVEPYLNAGRNGMPKEFLETFLKKEAEIKRRKSDIDLKKSQYAQQTKKMFFHAYDNYMEHAFPADELMPLSCEGRVRGFTKSRGEVDDALGRYMLTLVDSLDTLLILKEYDRFEDAVTHVIRGLSFDTDIVVNLFEANIRILGGLLGAHTGCLYLQSIGRVEWYSNEVLLLATELANRLLPAFDTPTGLPLPRINLRHGTFGITDNETCTACAGTLYMEFAALSRFTGNTTYENRARAALEYLYNHRAGVSDLPGSVINVNSGLWVRKDTSVGAGIDSYYEYLAKGYIMSGDSELWDMFQTHYQATRRYLKKNQYMLSVHSASPQNRVREHQDSLQAFWPGLQVLVGDIKEAAEVYDHYIQVSKQNQNTLPEAFMLDLRMYWPQYYIRPELLESTYFLYQATRDPKYIDEAATIMRTIENKCKVQCGYATLKSTATGELEDRLDSFVLAETFKYLYLIFAEDDEIGIPMKDYIFTTEAHIIPLHIQFYSSEKVTSVDKACENRGVYAWSWLETALFGQYYSSSNVPINWHACSPDEQPILARTRTLTSGLKAADFDYRNVGHTSTLLTMGIVIEFIGGDKVQLIHNSVNAHSEQLAVEGMIFMKEIQEHTKAAADIKKEEHSGILELFVQSLVAQESVTFEAGRAMFGPPLINGARSTGTVVATFPADGCSVIINAIKGKVALIHRGGCMFVEKVRNAEQAGAIAAVILDTNDDTSGGGVVAMSGDGKNDVIIPSLLINKRDGEVLLSMYSRDSVTLLVELREPDSQNSEAKCGS